MKPFLLILMLIIVVGGFLFAGKFMIANREPAPNLEGRTEVEVIEGEAQPESETTPNGMTGAEHETETGESSTGSDVGMEVPVADADVATPIDAIVFDVTGQNFSFNMKEMRVKKGDTVIIRFKSSDGFHDWVIDEFNARTAQVRTGGEAQVTFVADKKGTFEYYCSVGNHRERGMVGTLIVE